MIVIPDVNECMLIPLSNLARSIGINISMGLFVESESPSEDNSNNQRINEKDIKTIESHGIKVQIQVRSYYQVASHLQSENLENNNDNQILEVIYRNSFGVKIDSSSPINSLSISKHSSTGTLLFQLKFQN